jgi:hypothetical protein
MALYAPDLEVLHETARAGKAGEPLDLRRHPAFGAPDDHQFPRQRAESNLVLAHRKPPEDGRVFEICEQELCEGRRDTCFVPWAQRRRRAPRGMDRLCAANGRLLQASQAMLAGTMRLRFILERDILFPLRAMSVPDSPMVGRVGTLRRLSFTEASGRGWRLGSGLHGPAATIRGRSS